MNIERAKQAESPSSEGSARMLPAERRAWYPLVLIFAVVALVIFAGGLRSYRNYTRHFRAGIEHQLSAITELKVVQIVQWRRERLGNADYLRRTPYVARRALDVLAQPESLATRQNFTAALEALFAGGCYEQALLLDERLNMGLVYPEGASGVLGEAARRAAQEALRSRQVVVADLHRETEAGPVYLSLMVPFVVRRESTGDNVPAAGKGSSPTDRSAGLLVLQINANKELYPLIQQWPTPSKTAETLLVRRDGNDALFLNDLKFRTNAALKLRIPLARTNVSAVKAALGQEGIIDGIDYRGEPVVAALRAISGSPWSMVARMDLAEVYAPIRERLWLTVLLMGALLLGAGASVGLVWRQQHIQIYRERHEAAEARIASEVRYSCLFDNMLNGLAYCRMLFDGDRPQDFVYLAVNEAFGTLTGLKDVVGKKVSEVIPGIRETDPKLFEIYGRVASTGVPERFEIYVEALRMWFAIAVYCPEKHCFVAVFDVITERKRAEMALRESETKYRTLVENIPQKIFIKDRNLRWVSVNENFARDLRIQPEEVVGKVDHDFFPKELADKYRADDERIMLTGRAEELEEKYLQDGREAWVRVVKTPVRDERGEITGIFGIFWDITERRQAEEELRLSQQRLALHFHQTPLAVIEFDPEGRVREWNPAAVAVFGYSREEAVGQHWTFIVRAAVHGQLDGVWAAIVGQRGGSRSTNENITKGGRTINCEWFNTPLVERDGRTIGVASLIQDVTERKRADEALRESERSLRETQRIARLGSYVLHIPSGRWSSSDVLNKVFGIGEGYECSVEGWVALVHPDDRTVMADYFRNEVVAQGRPFDKEYRIVRHDDQAERWVHGYGELEFDAEGHPVKMHGTIQDVTERKRVEEEIRELNQTLEQRVVERTAQLEAANKELETFSYSVSHDLRAPLRAIDGFARILEEEYTVRLDDEGRRLLDVICGEAKRMGQLIDDLLTFSRMSRQHVEAASIDMTALAQAVFDECAAQVPGRQFQLKVQPLPPAQGDRAMLRQALANLFSNAIKYTRPRAVAEIEIGGRVEGEENLYYVKDNGVGFDMKYAGKLFGVFQRLHNADEFEGTGVGLALVQRVIRRHGGLVWAEATLNEGSTFYFTLPMRKDGT
jgi:PAS domain S-box-containing protein